MSMLLNSALLNRSQHGDLNMFRAVIVIMGFLVASLYSQSVVAWGNQGHQVVCAIAYKLLPSTKKSQLTRRTRAYQTSDGHSFHYYTSACKFPDIARFKARDGEPGWTRFDEFGNWHFFNVPRNTREINSNESCDDCVLKGIEHHLARSKDGTLEDWQRTESLFFLGHWIGDLHQPLHISFKDDLGGNSIKPIKGGFYSSKHLHQVWDSGILSRQIGEQDWWTYAGALAERVEKMDKKTLTDWQSTSPAHWANESYQITTTANARYCEWKSGQCRSKGKSRTLTESYQDEFGPVVEERLMKAGVRLAHYLRSVL